MPKASTTTRKSTKRKAPAKQTTASQKQLPVEPPTKTLIIDNGGDSVKFGWSEDAELRKMPNVTARLPQQWTVLVGDQLFDLQNPNSASVLNRSTERGIINNMGNQIQVWKRILDLMNISIPVTETATAFGWKPNSGSSTESNPAVPSANCAVLLALPPYCPRSVLDQICLVWFGDFGFSHVGFCVSSVVASIARPIKERPVACVIDLGWSATHIVPVVENRAIPRAIRRLPIGARHLINIWKHFTTYRQFNMMDQEWVIRHCFEETSLVSLDFDGDMKISQRKPPGRRPYDRAYLLPDFDRTFQGVVEIPASVRRELERKEGENSDSDGDEEEDSDYDENDMQEDDGDVEMETGYDIVEEEQDQSDEEESQEELRKRLLLQREEEERRRRELEAQQQVLQVSVERFAIPEALFRPSDMGFPVEWAGLATAIVQAIEACPIVYRAALYQSVVLVGGLSKLDNLKPRLERDLRAEVPSQYKLCVSGSDKPEDQAWLGARALSAAEPYEKWSISRDEWLGSPKKRPWRRLLASDGGLLV